MQPGTAAEQSRKDWISCCPQHSLPELLPWPQAAGLFQAPPWDQEKLRSPWGGLHRALGLRFAASPAPLVGVGVGEEPPAQVGPTEQREAGSRMFVWGVSAQDNLERTVSNGGFCCLQKRRDVWEHRSAHLSCLCSLMQD